MRVLGGGTVPERGRRTLEALDGLRGLAVLAVMTVHFERFVPGVGALVPLKQLATYGWAGVDLFFVLSGFLITGILEQTKGAPNYFRSFYARRTLRIFPIYYATLIVVFVAAARFPAGLDRVPPPAERWLYFAYLTNWIAVWKHAWPPNVLGHFWSLAVEEQFYLVWPACVLLLSRRALAFVAGALCAVALVVRCVWFAHTGPDDGITLATVTRMDDLLAGALIALAFLRPQAARYARVLRVAWVAPLAVFAASMMLAPPAMALQTVGFSLLAAGFAALVLGVALGDAAADAGRPDSLQRILRFSALRRVGRYSYGMYVYHVPMLGICELLIFDRASPALRANVPFALAYVTFLTVATFAVAAVSYELVERRILALKRYFEPGVAPAREPHARVERSPRQSAPPASPRS